MGPITAAIYGALKSPGTLAHEGREIRCLDGHLICTMDDHLPGTVAHAWTNSEFTDDLWILDSAQTAIDWTNPVCQICQKGLAP